MKELLLIVVNSLLFVCSCYSQSWENKIKNYSFEQHQFSLNNWNKCQGCGNDPYNCGVFFKQLEYMQLYWDYTKPWTIPLQKEFCFDINPPVPTADLYHISCRSFNGARSGEYWGYTSGEYLIAPTNYSNGGLKSSKTYYLEIFHNGSGNNEKVVLYEKQPAACGYNKDLIEYNANKNHDILLDFNASNNSGWTRYRTYFSPSSNKSWLSFGDGGTWDDIRIYEVQPNKCRTNWYFDNTVFNYPNEVFQASNNIYVGNGVDPENGVNHIPGDVIQYGNTKVVLRAGNQVIIDSTFIMENPANVLILENSPCLDNLCPEKLNFENQILCSEPTKVIGPDPNNYGTTVQWSPSTHLSSSTVSNPTFTAPSGTGAIEYTVTVTYECDASVGTQTETHHVVVQYTNSTETSATLTASNTQWDDYNFSTDLNFSDGVTEITIEVDGSPGYSKTFYKGIDYTCCNFSWTLPNAWKWSSCKNNVVTITAKNKCSDEQSVITLPWNKATTPFSGHPTLPNVVTPNGDNVNDQLCFTISSADYYSIIVFNRWNNPIYSAYAVEVKDNLICLPEFDDLTDGTYFYMLTLFDNCGNSSANAQFLHVFNSNGLAQPNETENAQANSSRKKNEFYSNSSGRTQEQVILIPNPSTDIVEIRGITEYVKIEVIDNTGKLVPVHLSPANRIDVSRLAAGLYYVKIISKNTTVIKKLVVL